MIRQKYYEGCYSPGLTSAELRRMAELLEFERLPTDPFTIMGCESAGLIVDLESGALYNESAPGVPVGNVSQFPPIHGADHLPPMLTLIDVLKMPKAMLMVDGSTMWWDADYECYKVDTFQPTAAESFATCAAALRLLLKSAQEAHPNDA